MCSSRVDGGEKWLKLRGGAPNIPFRDLVIQERENDLVGATFGRGFWVLDDYTPLRAISEETLAEQALLFPPRRPGGTSPHAVAGLAKRLPGRGLLHGAQPAFGAVFTYYLKRGVAIAGRSAAGEGKGAGEGGQGHAVSRLGGAAPGRVGRRAGHRADGRDTEAAVVRTLIGPKAKGIHRVAWDLRYPNLNAETDGQPDENGSGMLAPPGTYTVELAQRVDGVLTPLAGPESFDVVPMRERGLPGLEPVAMSAFLQEVAEVQRQVSGTGAALDGAVAQVSAIKAALSRADAGQPGLYATAVDLATRLGELNERLRGNRRRGRLNSQQPVSISGRLGSVQGGTYRSTYGPTAMHREQFGIAQEQFAAVREALRGILEEELPRLEGELEAAGVPWTTGRGVPSPR